jgi:hypothetical protein
VIGLEPTTGRTLKGPPSRDPLGSREVVGTHGCVRGCGRKMAGFGRFAIENEIKSHFQGKIAPAAKFIRSVCKLFNI